MPGTRHLSCMDCVSGSAVTSVSGAGLSVPGPMPLLLSLARDSLGRAWFMVAHFLFPRATSSMDVYDDRAGSQACISVAKEAGSLSCEAQ